MSDLAFLSRICPRSELGPWPAVETPAVYALVPPLLSLAGVSDYVIVATDYRARRVDLFACDEDGLIEDWDPVAEFPGVSQEAALRASGYEVVVIDAAA